MSLRPPEDIGKHPVLQRVWGALAHPRGYLAGGFVRDSLLGRTCTDLDLSLIGSADDIAEPAQRLADSLGTRAHLLGEPPRCVWRIETNDLKVELWPLGSLSISDDILRRDFTCNALVWEMPHGPFIDRVGGLDDLASGRLAAISRGNLQDDPVRLLRAARFLAELPHFRVDHQTVNWIRELSPRLAYAPRSRIGQELIKTLRAEGAERGVRSIFELDLFRASAPTDSALNPDWLHEHAEACTLLASAETHPVPPSLEAADDGARLVPLLVGWGCPTDDAVADFGWPRRTRKYAVRSARMIDRARSAVDASSADRRQLINEAGDAFPTLLAAAAAIDRIASPASDSWRRWWDQWRRMGSDLVNPRTLLAADEVANIIGCDPGPDLGDAMSALTTAQVRGEIRNANGARRWLQRWDACRRESNGA